MQPQTFYRWHVTAIINGSEGPASAEASATARASPRLASNPEIVRLVRQQSESAGTDRRGSAHLLQWQRGEK
jgi:hypothetical protein